jgi:formiminotetrahydrofolate cyclodeaminase
MLDMPRADPLDLRVRELLDEVAAGPSSLGGGAAAALATALAAALLARAARASREVWDEAAGAAAQAEALRAKAAPLAEADAAAWGQALGLLDAAGAKPRKGDELAAALDEAARLPHRIAEVAADVAELGVLVADRAEPALRPDAVSATVLAAAAAQAGAHLVRVNLATSEGDERLRRADRLAEAAGGAARRALDRPAS